ncbi:MAG: acylneuraminate cytidylyltransferase family protein [Vicinamibacterales bacterium]
MKRRSEVLAVVTARGGSKGLPGKNLVDLCGRPLIAWTLAAAEASSATRVIVSTDDAAIADEAGRWNAEVPFLRPAELAADDTPGIAVVRHALDWCEEQERYQPDIVVHLQPTSPLRTAEDINAALRLLEESRADAVVSVCEATHHPFWIKRTSEAGWLTDLVAQAGQVMRRQDLPEALAVNGALYLARPAVARSPGGWFGERTKGYLMPPDRSIDVDTEFDLRIAQCLLAQRLRNQPGARPE